jgi:uncharacterized membrane protein
VKQETVYSFSHFSLSVMLELEYLILTKDVIFLELMSVIEAIFKTTFFFRNVHRSISQTIILIKGNATSKLPFVVCPQIL